MRNIYILFTAFFFSSFLLTASSKEELHDTTEKYKIASLQNENKPIAEESNENLSENRKKAVNSAVVALVIIIVALTPKLLLIYSARKKSDKKTSLESLHSSSTQLHSPSTSSHHTEIEEEYFNNSRIEIDKELRELVVKNDPLFLNRFKEVYPGFTKHIMKKHPDLIKSEFQLCAMIYLNFSTKEIAEYTYIQLRSVQTNRSRLRKKMRLSSKVNLDQYIRTFE